MVDLSFMDKPYFESIRMQLETRGGAWKFFVFINVGQQFFVGCRKICGKNLYKTVQVCYSLRLSIDTGLFPLMNKELLVLSIDLIAVKIVRQFRSQKTGQVVPKMLNKPRENIWCPFACTK